MSLSARPTSTLCIVAPFYNEADGIAGFYEALRDELLLLDDVDYRCIFVDDGSQDSTLEQLNAIAAGDEAVRVISLSRNFGHQIALTAGLDHADGDAVVMMDSDLQHPPQLISEMVDLWRGGADVVSAVRQDTEDATFFKRLSSRMFYALVRQLTDTPIVPGACDFCLLSRAAHQALLAMPERQRFLRGMIAWIGFRRAFVPFRAPRRAAGESKYSLRRMTRLALDAVFSFSTVPIRMAYQVGALVLLAAGTYMTYILGRYWLLGDLVPGWGSLICTVLILNGIQLVFTGLIGEYLARTFEEAKGRPTYLLKQPLRVNQRTEAPPAAAKLPPLGTSSAPFESQQIEV